MAAAPPSLRSQYKTNSDKYTDALDGVAQQEMCRVVMWLYQGGSQYVGDYLSTLPGGMKFLYKDQKALMARREPPTNMDISHLYHIVRRTCGLSPEEDPIWDKPVGGDVHSLEHSLYLLKEERNDHAHKTRNKKLKMSDEELRTKIDNLRTLCCRILCEAARRSGRYSILAERIDTLTHKLEEIKGITPKMYAQMAKEERRKMMEEQRGGGGQDGSYLKPRMTFEDHLVPLEDLLRWGCSEAGDFPPVVVVSGEAGAGKTHLCQHLEDSWLKGKDDIKDLQECDLVLFIRCRDVSTSDLVRLLQEDLLPDTTAFCDPYSIVTMLQELRIVWVLDGLEEATEDATRLLEKMFRKKIQCHSVLLTSRPEHSLAMMNKFLDMKILRLTLCGVDPQEAFLKWFGPMDTTRQGTKRVRELISDFGTLGAAVKEELQNPLKLQLVLQDWKNTLIHLRQGFDLSRLYLIIKDAQKTLLVSKLTKGNVTEEEARRKVEKWFRVLCKVAFDMTRAQRITSITNSVLTELEDTCDHLQISSSECLSTFLAHQNGNSTIGRSGYAFYHNTQQYFFAALHVASTFSKSTNVLSDICQMFDVSPSGDEKSKSLVNFYEVLLHLISILGSSVSDNHLDLVVKLLSHAILDDNGSVKWFEVIRKGLYDERLAEKICTEVPSVWYVSDSSVEAAKCLVDCTTPSHVVIQLDKNPRHSSELPNLLRRLGESSVGVELYLSYHFNVLGTQSTSDEYLSLICRKDSPCDIVGFEGHLSDQGYDLLRRENVADCCEVLKLKVKTVKSLELLCNAVEDVQYLDSFHLTLALRNPSITRAQLLDRVDLRLPYMNENNVTETAGLVARLSPTYNSIAVTNITEEGAKAFVVILRKKGVSAGSLVRELRDQEGRLVCSLSYGPLPLKYPLLEFMVAWHDWERFILDTIRSAALKQQ